MKHLSTLVVLLTFLTGYGQKTDLDRYSFTASYRELPRLPLDTSYRTFSVRSMLGQGASYVLKNERPEDRISIIGWSKVQSRGDLLLDIQMEDIAINNSEVKEREEILKDKSGKEIGRRYFYCMELLYSFSSIMQLSDFKGAVIISRPLADRRTQKVFRTKEYRTSGEALNAFVSNVFVVTADITALEVNQSLNTVNSILNAEIGYSPRTAGDFLWILDSKKHPEYQAHRQAWATFKLAMFQMRADKPLNETAEQLKPVIAYFNWIKTRYNSNSKSDRKMRYASYYNLSKIYYYLDNPDAALYEAGQLTVNDYDEKDGRSLEASATYLKQLFESTGIHTRHFPVVNDIASGSAYVGGY